MPVATPVKHEAHEEVRRTRRRRRRLRDSSSCCSCLLRTTDLQDSAGGAAVTEKIVPGSILPVRRSRMKMGTETVPVLWRHRLTGRIDPGTIFSVTAVWGGWGSRQGGGDGGTGRRCEGGCSSEEVAVGPGGTTVGQTRVGLAESPSTPMTRRRPVHRPPPTSPPPPRSRPPLRSLRSLTVTPTVTPTRTIHGCRCSVAASGQVVLFVVKKAVRPRLTILAGWPVRTRTAIPRVRRRARPRGPDGRSPVVEAAPAHAYPFP